MPRCGKAQGFRTISVTTSQTSWYAGRRLLAVPDPQEILEPIGTIRRDIDVRFAAGNQVGDDAARRRGREGGLIIEFDAGRAEGGINTCI